jgi:hypothetical protein
VSRVQQNQDYLRVNNMWSGDVVAGGIRSTGVDKLGIQSRICAQPAGGMAERCRSVGDGCGVSGAGLTE